MEENDLISENHAGVCIGSACAEDSYICKFRIAVFPSYDISALYLTIRKEYRSSTLIFGLISHFVVVAYCREVAEFIEVQLAIDGEDLLVAQSGILHDGERKSAYSIGGYRRDIDQCRCQKPACLDQDSGDQGAFDDSQRAFGIGFSERENIFEYREKHNESECEVSEVFQHIPEFPERSIHMEK
jgi:hypothetical protein